MTYNEICEKAYERMRQLDDIIGSKIQGNDEDNQYTCSDDDRKDAKEELLKIEELLS